MKRFLVCILTLAMLLALTGCFFAQPDIGGTVEPNPSEPTNTSLSLGEFSGGVYTNKYLGIRCKLDSKWTFYSADQLQDLPDTVKDQLEGSALESYMEKATQVLDMMAENVDDLTIINLLYTKLSVSERLMYAAMTEEQIVDGVLSQGDLLKSSYQQMGITVQEMKKVTVTFLGKTHYALWMKSIANNADYYTLQLYDYSAGAYSATITLASYVEDKTQTLLPLFEKMN